MSNDTYNTRTIRKLLVNTFTVAQLRELCEKHDEFRPILHNLKDDPTRNEIVNEMIDYCRRRLLLDKLAAEAQKAIPPQTDLTA